MKWKDDRCQDDTLPEFFVTPDLPLDGPDESEAAFEVMASLSTSSLIVGEADS